jgi:type VI secretion system protein ImpK
MSISSSHVIERRANLSMSLQELFTAIVRLRFNRQDVPNADVFKAHMREGLRVAMQDGMAKGYSPDDVKTAAFALVAFLDESILNSANPVFAKWSGQSLQEELFGKHLAGEHFFVYVQHLLGRRDSAEAADVLEVLYLCLLLGYRGKYGLSNMGELHAIMGSIREKITRCRGASTLLSPSAKLPLDPPQMAKSDPWFKRLAIVAAGAAVLSLVIFIVCKIALSGGVSHLDSMAGR